MLYKMEINNMQMLVNFHGYNKCMMLYVNMCYAEDPIWFESQTDLFELSERQLAIELAEMLDVHDLHITEVETKLDNAFDKHLPDEDKLRTIEP